MILFFGDTHGERSGGFNHVDSVVNQNRPSAIIFLGDLGAQKPLHEELANVKSEIYFIHGNHDSDNQTNYDNLFKSKFVNKNLHGRVVEIDGYKVAGLGGVFDKEIWHPKINGGKVYFKNYEDYFAHLLAIQKENPSKENSEFDDESVLTNDVLINKALKHRASIFPDDYWGLADQFCDVLVTHEAPSFNNYGFEEIELLAGFMKANHTFHGHLHKRFNYGCIDNLNAHGVGYRGVSNLKGEVIRPGDYDNGKGNGKHSNKSSTRVALEV